MNRFTSEQEILDLIDKYRLEIDDLKKRADSRDHLADCLKSTEEAHRIPGIRDSADQIRNGCEWRIGRLKTLGEKLSEMRTPQLPGADNGDTSVPTS